MLARAEVAAGWYVHRPTSVEAIQYTPLTSGQTRHLLTDWGAAWWEASDGTLRISTPQGTRPVWYGDWVLRGTVGEIWPVRDDVFQRSYDGPRGAPPRA
jgi:hypothetical protein